ncbi:MAG: zinc-ribbon domain-containing protein, partial [Deltaproteobacteria bacterium]|nr:zinc-ribbon domain-containing protein [Deltaproteobacteria bacterium]
MICSKCGANLPEEYMFCAQCGEPLPKKAQPEPQPEPETIEKHTDPRHQSDTVLDARGPQIAYSPEFRFRVVRLSRSGGAPKEFLVGENGMRVGTEDCEVTIEDDPLVSTFHAIFFYGADGLRVKDLDSLNGVYYKISEKTRMVDGMMFLCGEVYLCPELEKGRQKASDKFLGSIVKLPPLYLRIIYQGGAAEEIYPVYESPFNIGK